MPSYPTPSDYQEALQFPETAFRDPELKEAHPEENVLGLPQPITGNFAAVFPMTTRGGVRWAVKCFLTNVPDQQTRYQTIANHLETHRLPALVEFEYQAEGIRVESETYPLLKMEWAEGRPINQFVEDHLDDPETLAALAEAWTAMMEAMEAADVAHGDLQHGNALVKTERDGLRLTLVDYDTMYVPALEGRTSPEVGHRNYQHPDRTKDDFGPYLDRFSGLTIYTALRATLARPGLWSRFDTGENLLFRAADFYDPAGSVLFDELEQHEALRPLVEALRTACYVEPEAVPSLSGVLKDEATIQAGQAASGQRRRRRKAGDRSPFARWLMPAIATAAGAALMVLLIGWWEGALSIFTLTLVAVGWMSKHRYQQLSVVRRHRRLSQEVEHVTRMIERLERQVESLRQKRRDVLSSAEERRAGRLRELQDEALYDRLKYHFIGEAREVDGITHKQVVRLKAAGIRTVYGITPRRLEALHRIGDKTRTRLLMWRSALETQYKDDIPDALSPAEERRIERYIEHRVDDLEAEIARVEEKIQVQDEERARVQARKEELPAPSFARYLRHLLRLDRLPEGRERSPAPTSPPTDRTDAGSVSVPEPLDDDRPWWTQT